MQLQLPQSAGSADNHATEASKTEKVLKNESSSLPFGQHLPLSSISGPTYLTAQTLIQQVAYALSDKIFTYSPETFDLDVAVKSWKAHGEKNSFGYETGLSTLETRSGAGSIVLGYVFSKDFDVKKRHIPQSIITSSSSLHQLRPALDQFSLVYSVANPLVVHVAAVDYASNSSPGLVTDYVTALNLADDLGLGLVSSVSAYEAQHMSLFATLLANTLPTIHIYDGVNVGRETTRVVDVLSRVGLRDNYSAIHETNSSLEKRHTDNEGQALRLLKAFNDELGTSYKAFEYHGHASPKSILVTFGTVEASLAAQVVSNLAKDGVEVGVINVRIYRPFIEEEFLESLPKSVNKIFVLGQVLDDRALHDESEHSLLYGDVLAAVSFLWQGAPELSISDLKYSRDQVWTPADIIDIFNQIVGNSSGSQLSADLLDGNVLEYTFWNTDDSTSLNAPLAIGRFLALDSTVNVSLRTGHDNLVQGGVVKSDLRASSISIEAAYSVSEADVAFVGDEKLFNEFDVTSNIQAGGALIARLPGFKEDDIGKRLSTNFFKHVLDKGIQLYILDPLASEMVAEDASLEVYLTQLSFLKVAKPEVLQEGLQKLANISGDLTVFEVLIASLDNALRHINIPEASIIEEPEAEASPLPRDISINSFVPFDKTEQEPPTLLKTWVTAAQGLAFKEAYGTKTALRPDLGIKTSVVRIKERRRLTPQTYDRNIFHIEFDLGDSGVTYAIGEALGIHAENDPAEVEEFIKWYGLNPAEIVEVPTREDPNVLENRTVYQALLQNVDIFGRPPKRFYEALAEFASDEKEKQALLALTTPDGAVEFKRRAEVDTITFADILLEFPSAHPSFNDIIRIVSPMKRREYSIASSQRVTPNSVSLLIVTVGWVDPKGRDRFGQATRYLNSLKVGDPVTVSVKPSVMKLPPKTTAPIIMAGLGTGLAPFRAFVQERALQKQLGEPIGPILLYMGSRHQREEYLYGEEWEAYQSAGIITLLGRAFSRDQPQKIYIQDRMRESIEEIRDAYLKEGGSFYLCGPTWPVPDVTDVLMEAIELEAKAKGRRVDKRREIETLKEDGRYVLEVY